MLYFNEKSSILLKFLKYSQSNCSGLKKLSRFKNNPYFRGKTFALCWFEIFKGNNFHENDEKREKRESFFPRKILPLKYYSIHLFMKKNEINIKL